MSDWKRWSIWPQFEKIMETKSKKTFRDTVSGMIHFVAAIIAIAGTVFLCTTSNGGTAEIVPKLIFGLSMVLLLAASAAYHLVRGPEKLISRLKKIDHSMIYVLIAGTYTPVVSVCLTGTLRLSYIVGIWVFALLGVIFKIFYAGRFRIVSTILYIIMGWSIVFAISPLARVVGTGGLILLLSGGVLYSIGAIFYMLKRPNISKNFGFHELFHVLIVLAAGAFYAFILVYVN
jgi:channel protein, hemolysin III family